MTRSQRLLTAAAALLALCVVTLGAYVRLKDAGLGCPDWPGCYGQLVGVPQASADGAGINRAKAWIEVSHRYLAAVLGLLVLAMAVQSFRARSDRSLVLILVLLVAAQAGLGALTVTELLRPVIVTSHLLGGMAIFALLAAMSCRGLVRARPSRRTLAVLAVAGLLLAVQVALGGWVSSNYAGLACGPEFPKCSGSWLPKVADLSAFATDRALGVDAAGEPITQQALAVVQWAHRLGALALALAVAVLAAGLLADGLAGVAAAIVALLLTQVMLGAHIVLSHLPLTGSLLHNLVAALLCAALAVAAVAGRPAAAGRMNQ